MNWPTTSLKRVALIQMGQSPPGHTYNDQGDGLPFFQGKADFGELHPAVRMWCSKPNRVAEPGDVLLSVRAPVGPTNVANQQCCIGRGLAAIRSLAPDALLPEYIRYVFKWVEPSLSLRGQGSTFSAINRKDVEGIEFPLPAPREQRRIVTILDQADALRQQRRDADEKALRVLPALFHKFFGDPVGNPKGWPLKRMAEVVEIGTRLVDPNQSQFLDLPHVGGEHIERDTGRLLEPPLVRDCDLRSSKFHFTDNHILYSKIRPYLNKVAFPACEGVCSADIYPLRPKDKQIGVWYLIALLRTPAFLAYAKVHSERLRMPKLNRDQLGAFEIPIPDPKLVESFESVARHTVDLLNSRQAAGARIDHLFDVLLHRAFTGELTAGWRKSHKDQLEAEMMEQLAALEAAAAEKPTRGRRARTAVSSGQADATRNAGHDMFNKAALVTYIVAKCHDPSRPLGRTKLAKLFYLVQRRAEIALTEQFARRAAGPLDDAIPKVLSLAKKNGWVTLAKAQGKLKPVVPGENQQPAIDHVKQRWAPSLSVIDDTLDTMKGWGWEALERWATVENAAQQLAAEGKPATLDAIKRVIASEPRWKPKLDRDAFSDLNIQRTLKGLRDHGYLPAEAGAIH